MKQMSERRPPRLRLAMLVFIVIAIVTPPATAEQIGVPPPGFSAADVTVGGSKLHYVRGGDGPAIVLLHGFPQDWTEYQPIMPQLAKRFTVVSVDLPGIGGSTPSTRGSRSVDLAEAVHGLADALHLDHPYIAGHDLGGHVAYAYLRRYPQEVRGAMIMDVPVPGLAGWDEANAGLWHVGFIQTAGLAEKLVSGRQEAFLGWFFDIGRFTGEARAYYAKSYGDPQLHAAFEIYRAFPADAEWNAATTAPDDVPLTVVVGEKSPFSKLVDMFLAGYRAKGMANVEGAVIPDAVHYLVADNPKAVAALIEQKADVAAP